MMAVSYFCTTIPALKAIIVGWIGLVFFGLCTIGWGVQLFRGGPTIVINEFGIQCLRVSTGPIPWSEVRLMWLGSVHSAKFLCIELQNPAAYLANLPSWKRRAARLNESLGFPPFTISFAGLAPGLNEVWDYLKVHHPEKIRD
jgi:hypothetical protein